MMTGQPSDPMTVAGMLKQSEEVGGSVRLILRDKNDKIIGLVFAVSGEDAEEYSALLDQFEEEEPQ